MLKRTLLLLNAVCIVTGTSRAADNPFAGKCQSVILGNRLLFA